MARKDEALSDYQRKRSFDKTPEPAGEKAAAQRRDRGNRFVVQEHHARRLHWDLRLERDGVLASWALPRGFPQTPKENRLAIHTEDHPLEYLTFQGDIPSGEYGGGGMFIWDSGTYEAEKYTDEKITMELSGERVQGKFALFQTDGNQWLIHRMSPPDPSLEPMPDDLVPMAATLSRSLPSDDDQWGFEIKWDGVRALGYGEVGRLRLISRTGRDLTRQYPELAPLVRALGSRRVVLDGELVAFDENGRPSFQRLQRRMHVESESEIRRRQREVPVTYVLFDLLYANGRSLLELPYEDRRAELEALELSGTVWQTPAFHVGDGKALLDASREQGLEGIIAKRLGSVYRPGQRSRDWLKVKNVRSQEVVIGGWVAGEGRRTGELGALLVGVYEGAGRSRKLRFTGKVGTGFDAADLRLLKARLAPLEVPESPFTGRQPQRDALFVRPELVCEVEFAEWTNTGTLRHPSYQGLRDDKRATEVVREEPVTPES